jgi:hypothetical protein
MSKDEWTLTERAANTDLTRRKRYEEFYFIVCCYTLSISQCGGRKWGGKIVGGCTYRVSAHVKIKLSIPKFIHLKLSTSYISYIDKQ